MKIDKSAHLQNIEGELRQLISREIEEVKSQNKQELEYTTNKLIYLESEILPQLEEIPKYKSNNDI